MRFWKERRARLGKEVWCFDGYIDRVRCRDSGFETRGEAEEAVSALRLQARNRKYGLAAAERDPVTLAQLVAERARDFDLTKKHHRRNKVVLETFRDFFPRHQLVAALTDNDLLAFKRARLLKSRLRPNSINRELEAVAAMFNSAGRYFPALRDWKHPRMSYEPVPEAGTGRVISHDEDARLLARLREDRAQGEKRTTWLTRLACADMVELALNAAMRGGEVRRLEKAWIEWGDGVVNLPAHATKRRRAREVPLNDAALDILRRRVLSSPHPRYVFTNAEGSNLIHYDQYRRTIAKAAAAVGLDYGRFTEGGFTPHDTRHTAITRMLRRGNDLPSVAAVAGHTKERMTMLYGHASPESMRRAVDSISTRRESPKRKTAGG